MGLVLSQLGYDMDAKKVLKDGVFCPMPWTGLMYNFDGTVKNCIRSAGTIGNIMRESIHDILHGASNRHTQSCMIDGTPGPDCHPCYDLESGKQKLDIISDRIFYIRELKHVPLQTYSKNGDHDLRTVDIRWTNLCNFACVYCGPEYSSKWARELGEIRATPTHAQIENFKNYVFEHIDQLDHVYLAGGEPLLMKENLEFLDELSRRRPGVNIRVNTNLSKVDTRIFERLCHFPNVHWTVSVESMGDQFEYIRYGGQWSDFLTNLNVIQKLPHKITFNMLYFLLNFWSWFDCVDFLQARGFHANSFVAGSINQPSYLNIRHLPDFALQSIKQTIINRLDRNPGYLLEESYKNILSTIDQPFQSDLARSMLMIGQMDHRRQLDSKEIFPDLYHIYEKQSWPNHLIR